MRRPRRWPLLLDLPGLSRLQRARLLLLQSTLSIIDVALACGFVSASHFSKCYRQGYDRSPKQERGAPA